MTCTRCGQASRVTETRHPQSAPRAWVGEIKRASEAVSWYTSDLVMRRRTCPDGHTWFTIECEVEDLRTMVREGQP
jgi:hypothetical protein